MVVSGVVSEAYGVVTGWSSATHVTMATGIRDQRRVKVRVREGGVMAVWFREQGRGALAMYFIHLFWF